MNDDSPTTRIDPVPEDPRPGRVPTGPDGGHPGRGATAWSAYPEDTQTRRVPDPFTDSGSHPPVPPIAPPPDRSDSDLDDDGSPPGRLTLAIAVVGIVVLLAAGALVWALLGDGGGERPAPAPPTPTAVPSSPTPATSPPGTTASSTSTAPPDAVARCGRDYLRRQFGATVTVRDCDGDFAMLEVPTGEHPLALYRWDRDRWMFVTDPYSGVCREQLDPIAVPERFRRDFPPCGPVPSPSVPARTTETIPTTAGSSTPASPTPSSTGPGPSPSGSAPVSSPAASSTPGGGATTVGETAAPTR